MTRGNSYLCGSASLLSLAAWRNAANLNFSSGCAACLDFHDFPSSTNLTNPSIRIAIRPPHIANGILSTSRKIWTRDRRIGRVRKGRRGTPWVAGPTGRRSNLTTSQRRRSSRFISRSIRRRFRRDSATIPQSCRTSTSRTRARLRAPSRRYSSVSCRRKNPSVSRSSTLNIQRRCQCHT